ncbi:cyclin-related protein, putative [Plasmodium berghei]|uniref:Cyclin-related protein, putative n=1 Tax=Plasmodium berghei TaxID=5821 RepID=A0A1D3Q757_PLABE|nr:cyclin-related protein, putative [Plasmodium berghei]
MKKYFYHKIFNKTGNHKSLFNYCINNKIIVVVISIMTNHHIFEDLLSKDIHIFKMLAFEMPKRNVIKYKGQMIISKTQYKKIIRKYIRIIKNNCKRKKFQIAYNKSKVPIQEKLYRKQNIIPIFHFGKHNVINPEFTQVNKIYTPYSFLLLIFVEYKYKMYSNSEGVQYNGIFLKKKQTSFKETIIVNIFLFTPNKYIWSICRMNENSNMNENALEKKSICEKKQSVNVFNIVGVSKNSNFNEGISINKNSNISRNSNISVNTNINKNSYINSSAHIIANINIYKNPYINGNICISANICKNTYIISGNYLIHNTYSFQRSHINKKNYANFNKNQRICVYLRRNYIKKNIVFIENAYFVAYLYTICILCTHGNGHMAEDAYIASIYLINIACRNIEQAKGIKNSIDNGVCTKFCAYINIWIYMVFYGMHETIKGREIKENFTKFKCNNSNNTINKCKKINDIYTYIISVYYVEIPYKKSLEHINVYERILIKNNKGRLKDIKKSNDIAKTTKKNKIKTKELHKILLKHVKMASHTFKKKKNIVKLLYAHIILKNPIHKNKKYIFFNYLNKNLYKVNKVFKVEDKFIIKYRYIFIYFKIFIFILKIYCNIYDSKIISYNRYCIFHRNTDINICLCQIFSYFIYYLEYISNILKEQSLTWFRLFAFIMLSQIIEDSISLAKSAYVTLSKIPLAIYKSLRDRRNERTVSASDSYDSRKHVNRRGKNRIRKRDRNCVEKKNLDNSFREKFDKNRRDIFETVVRRINGSKSRIVDDYFNTRNVFKRCSPKHKKKKYEKCILCKKYLQYAVLENYRNEQGSEISERENMIVCHCPRTTDGNSEFSKLVDEKLKEKRSRIKRFTPCTTPIKCAFPVENVDITDIKHLGKQKIDENVKNDDISKLATNGHMSNFYMSVLKDLDSCISSRTTKIVDSHDKSLGDICIVSNGNIIYASENIKSEKDDNVEITKSTNTNSNDIGEKKIKYTIFSNLDVSEIIDLLNRKSSSNTIIKKGKSQSNEGDLHEIEQSGLSKKLCDRLPNTKHHIVGGNSCEKLERKRKLKKAVSILAAFSKDGVCKESNRSYQSSGSSLRRFKKGKKVSRKSSSSNYNSSNNRVENVKGLEKKKNIKNPNVQNRSIASKKRQFTKKSPVSRNPKTVKKVEISESHQSSESDSKNEVLKKAKIMKHNLNSNSEGSITSYENDANEKDVVGNVVLVCDHFKLSNKTTLGSSTITGKSISLEAYQKDIFGRKNLEKESANVKEVVDNEVVRDNEFVSNIEVANSNGFNNDNEIIDSNNMVSGSEYAEEADSKDEVVSIIEFVNSNEFNVNNDVASGSEYAEKVDGKDEVVSESEYAEEADNKDEIVSIIEFVNSNEFNVNNDIDSGSEYAEEADSKDEVVSIIEFVNSNEFNINNDVASGSEVVRDNDVVFENEFIKDNEVAIYNEVVSENEVVNGVRVVSSNEFINNNEVINRNELIYNNGADSVNEVVENVDSENKVVRDNEFANNIEVANSNGFNNGNEIDSGSWYVRDNAVVNNNGFFYNNEIVNDNGFIYNNEVVNNNEVFYNDEVVNNNEAVNNEVVNDSGFIYNNEVFDNNEVVNNCEFANGNGFIYNNEVVNNNEAVNNEVVNNYGLIYNNETVTNNGFISISQSSYNNVMDNCRKLFSSNKGYDNYEFLNNSIVFNGGKRARESVYSSDNEGMNKMRFINDNNILGESDYTNNNEYSSEGEDYSDSVSSRTPRHAELFTPSQSPNVDDERYMKNDYYVGNRRMEEYYSKYKHNDGEIFNESFKLKRNDDTKKMDEETSEEESEEETGDHIIDENHPLVKNNIHVNNLTRDEHRVLLEYYGGTLPERYYDTKYFVNPYKTNDDSSEEEPDCSNLFLGSFDIPKEPEAKVNPFLGSNNKNFSSSFFPSSFFNSDKPTTTTASETFTNDNVDKNIVDTPIEDKESSLNIVEVNSDAEEKIEPLKSLNDNDDSVNDISINNVIESEKEQMVQVQENEKIELSKSLSDNSDLVNDIAVNNVIESEKEQMVQVQENEQIEPLKSLNDNDDSVNDIFINNVIESEKEQKTSRKRNRNIISDELSQENVKKLKSSNNNINNNNVVEEKYEYITQSEKEKKPEISKSTQRINLYDLIVKKNNDLMACNEKHEYIHVPEEQNEEITKSEEKKLDIFKNNQCINLYDLIVKNNNDLMYCSEKYEYVNVPEEQNEQIVQEEAKIQPSTLINENENMINFNTIYNNDTTDEHINFINEVFPNPQLYASNNEIDQNREIYNYNQIFSNGEIFTPKQGYFKNNEIYPLNETSSNSEVYSSEHEIEQNDETYSLTGIFSDNEVYNPKREVEQNDEIYSLNGIFSDNEVYNPKREVEQNDETYSLTGIFSDNEVYNPKHEVEKNDEIYALNEVQEYHKDIKKLPIISNLSSKSAFQNISKNIITTITDNTTETSSNHPEKKNLKKKEKKEKKNLKKKEKKDLNSRKQVLNEEPKTKKKLTKKILKKIVDTNALFASSDSDMSLSDSSASPCRKQPHIPRDDSSSDDENNAGQPVSIQKKSTITIKKFCILPPTPMLVENTLVLQEKISANQITLHKDICRENYYQKGQKIEKKESIYNTMKVDMIHKNVENTSTKSANTKITQIPIKSENTKIIQIPIKSENTKIIQMPIKSTNTKIIQIPIKSENTKIIQMPIKSTNTKIIQMPIKSTNTKITQISIFQKEMKESYKEISNTLNKYYNVSNTITKLFETSFERNTLKISCFFKMVIDTKQFWIYKKSIVVKEWSKGKVLREMIAHFINDVCNASTNSKGIHTENNDTKDDVVLTSIGRQYCYISEKLLYSEEGSPVKEYGLNDICNYYRSKIIYDLKFNLTSYPFKPCITSTFVYNPLLTKLAKTSNMCSFVYNTSPIVHTKMFITSTSVYNTSPIAHTKMFITSTSVYNTSPIAHTKMFITSTSVYNVSLNKLAISSNKYVPVYNTSTDLYNCKYSKTYSEQCVLTDDVIISKKFSNVAGTIDEKQPISLDQNSRMEKPSVMDRKCNTEMSTMSTHLINTNPSFTTEQHIPTYEYKLVEILVTAKQNTMLNKLASGKKKKKKKKKIKLKKEITAQKKERLEEKNEGTIEKKEISVDTQKNIDSKTWNDNEIPSDINILLNDTKDPKDPNSVILYDEEKEIKLEQLISMVNYYCWYVNISENFIKSIIATYSSINYKSMGHNICIRNIIVLFISFIKMNRYNILYFLNVLGGSVYYFQAIFQRTIEMEMSTGNKAINKNKGYPDRKKADNNALYYNLVDDNNEFNETTDSEPLLYNADNGTPVKRTNNSMKENLYDITTGKHTIGSISPPNSVEESDGGNNIENVKDIRYYQKLEELNELKGNITERQKDVKEKSEENDDEGEGDGVMERHSSILIHRGIRSKKLVDYSLYNTYAKSSFLQCAEQADNHFIGNYLGRYNDANFLHLRQKVKLCLCRTFAHIRNTCETCVLHFTHLIFDLYISRFNTKKELIQSIINDIHLNEKQYSDVMIQLLKQHYPTMYQEYLDKEELKQQYIPLYRALFESTDLIYHFIGIICLFISQKYFNYKTTSIIIIAKSYCRSHLEGLKRVYSINNELIKDVSPDYYSAAKYMGAVFTHGSISKRFALDLEIALLKKLNYDLSIPTAYSLLDSLLKSNKNINFSKLEKNYNLVEGEILLRMAGIDNSFLKYKSSTLSMAIYEILNFNICKDIMQRELSVFTKAKAYNELKEKNERMKRQLFLENEIREELKRKELNIMKRRERGLIIAEEEDRFIVASQYTNEKDNLQIYLKNTIVKICDAVDQKIPTNYYKSHYITEQIDRYIKDFNKGKKRYLKKLINRSKGKSKKKFVNKNDENTFGNIFNDDEAGYRNNEGKEPDNIEIGDKSEYCDENRKMKNDKNNEKVKKIEQKIKNEKKANMFYKVKKKILRIIKKLTKKLKKIKYSDIPIKYCTSYVLYGKDLKIYVKKHKGHYHDKENIMRSENEHMKDKEQQNSENNTCGGLSEGSSLKKKKNKGYIIGSKTESTDENLVYYYNYISRLRNRLIIGLKYFKNRINSIKKTDVSMKLLSLEYILNKKENKKGKNGKRNIRITKNISLYKQLLNEIKILFLWFYKLTNIEIRPLIKFSDLKFISTVKLYDKEYSKYIKNVLNANCANDNETKEITNESNAQTIKDGKEEYKGRQSGDIVSKNNKIKEIEYGENLADQKRMSYSNSIGYFKAYDQSIGSSLKIKTLQNVYIEEVLKTIETQTKNYDLFLTNDRGVKNKKRKNKSLDIEAIAKKKERKLVMSMATDIAKKHLGQINSNLEECILSEKQKYLDYAKTLNFTDGTRLRNIYTDEIIASDQDRNTNTDDMLETEQNIFERKQSMEIEKHQDDSILRLKEYGNFKNDYKSPGLVEKSVEKKNKKTIFTQGNLANDDKDWITINDPEVDECAKELMECFLKWKNKNFISKNWTYNEYPKCKEYYFSLVFSDLKSAKSLKGIVEMMHMKYMHLLNICKEINNQQNMLEDD